MALLLGYTIWRENVLGNRLTQSQDAETGMKNQLLEYKELLQITQVKGLSLIAFSMGLHNYFSISLTSTWSK